MRRPVLLLGLVALTALAAAAGWLWLRAPHPAPAPAVVPSATATPSTVAATYVGADSCKGCHAKQYQDWLGSHHQLAMQDATEATVLGDFHDAKLTHFKVTSRFFRRDGRFFVNTDGADGTLRDFEIRYTFGVYPLQQYLVAFPDGRLQALPLAWDTRPKTEGGQRWIHLYPKESVPAGDELHWTGLEQNWNYMCAECHSTDLRKNYDASSNTYRTTWKDISVACEACHGAGSAHVQWATQRARGAPAAPAHAAPESGDGLLAHFDDRRGVDWIADPATGNAHRSRARADTHELEMCGRCHARAAKISEHWAPGQPLLDTHRVSLLEEGLYTADGQMQGEVYNYGSFLQSRMYAAGVTCSDCHEPHTQKLRVTEGEVCGQCHALAKYAATAHHHHREQSPESRCAACHMPVRTYMVVDRRHDHSFRIPRPDESVRYGTPNACNDCHKDRTPAWAAQQAAAWYGPKAQAGYQHFAGALHAARTQSATAGTDLVKLARDESSPAIARATALGELGAYLDADALAAAQNGLRSGDALMRLAAVELVGGADRDTRWQQLAPLLTDPVLAVRSAAAAEIVDAVPADASPETSAALRQALGEYVATQELNADRPEAHLSLGNLYAHQGKAEDAKAQYEQAVKLWPGFIPAYVNLADLSRALQRDDEAERWLAQASRAAPENAAIVFSLALLRVRQHRTDESLQLLARAVRLAPDNPHYGYVYAVGQYSTGKTAPALQTLRRLHERFPGNREVLYGLASLLAESGDKAAAQRYTAEFAAMAPADPRAQQLRAQLEGHPQAP